MSPLISVVIPTYNRASHLPGTINSVLAQTFHDYEIIIVDDGSTDDTEQVVASLNAKNISYLRHKENLGVSAARNTGIKASKGKYIAFLDSDDLWLPGKLEQQLAIFLKSPPGLGLVYANVDFHHVPTGLITQYKLPFIRGCGHAMLLDVNCIVGGGSSTMIRSECIEKVGYFDEKMLSSEDWDLWLRISEHFLIDYCEDVLVVCKTHSDNISADMARTIAGREHFLLKHAQRYTHYPNISARQYYRLGIYCLKNNFRKRARRHFLTACSLAPRAKILFRLKCILQQAVSHLHHESYLFFRKLLLGRE